MTARACKERLLDAPEALPTYFADLLERDAVSGSPSSAPERGVRDGADGAEMRARCAPVPTSSDTGRVLTASPPVWPAVLHWPGQTLLAEDRGGEAFPASPSGATSRSHATRAGTSVVADTDRFEPPAAPVEVIRFSTAGFALMMPVRGVATIVKADPGRLTPIPAAAAWKCGWFEHDGRTLTLVRIDALLAASRYAAAGGAVAETADAHRPTSAVPTTAPQGESKPAFFWLVLADAPLAIAVDRVERIDRVAPSALRFRRRRRHLDWLAAIERDSLATLLDVDRLVAVLLAGGPAMAGSPSRPLR